MKPRTQRTLVVVDDPGPGATVLRFAPGAHMIGQADEDYLCGGCSAVVCESVSPSNFGPNLFVACGACGKVNAPVRPETATRLHPQQELKAAAMIAENAFRVAKQDRSGPPFHERFCVVMNAGTPMGKAAAMTLAVTQGQSREDADRNMRRVLADSADPLLGSTVNLPLLRTLLDAAGAPAVLVTQKAWLETPPTGDCLRVIVISSVIQLFAVQGHPREPSIDRSMLN